MGFAFGSPQTPPTNGYQLQKRRATHASKPSPKRVGGRELCRGRPGDAGDALRHPGRGGGRVGTEVVPTRGPKKQESERGATCGCEMGLRRGMTRITCKPYLYLVISFKGTKAWVHSISHSLPIAPARNMGPKTGEKPRHKNLSERLDPPSVDGTNPIEAVWTHGSRAMMYAWPITQKCKRKHVSTCRVSFYISCLNTCIQAFYGIAHAVLAQGRERMDKKKGNQHAEPAYPERCVVIA